MSSFHGLFLKSIRLFIDEKRLRERLQALHAGEFLQSTRDNT